MKRHSIAGAAIFALVTGAAAYAGDIYKWVDEDGNVHYGDVPVGKNPERMAIQSRPTNELYLASQADALVASREHRRERRAAAAEKAAEKAEADAEAAELARQCEMAREQMQKYETSRRLYLEDENGERTWLDEDEKQAEKKRLAGQIDEHCS